MRDAGLYFWRGRPTFREAAKWQNTQSFSLQVVSLFLLLLVSITPYHTLNKLAGYPAADSADGQPGCAKFTRLDQIRRSERKNTVSVK